MKIKLPRFRSIILIAGDIICLLLGLFLALALRYGFPIPPEQIEIHRVPFSIIFGIWLLIFFGSGLFQLRSARNQRSFFTIFFKVFSINASIAVFFFYFIAFFSISPKTVMFLDLGATLLFLLLWRVLFNRFITIPPLKLAILGNSPEVKELLEDIKKHPQQGYACVLHSPHPPEAKEFISSLRDTSADALVVAVDYRHSPILQKSLLECLRLQIQFFDFVDFYEAYFQKVPHAAIDQTWFLENFNELGKRFFSIMKRATDIFFAIFLGFIGLILFPLIALAVWLEMERPIFYSQIRVGHFEKPFHIFKFRSMHHNGDTESISMVGKFLRRSHLDEIPQLWNILKGEMSFVGPRPEQVGIVEQLKSKIPFYAERFLVPPGITGWAQLHEPHAKAEDALTKLQYDLFYIKNRSILLDIEIILKTLRILLG